MIDLIAGLMLWAALLWTTLSGLVPRFGRWGWWIAGLFLAAWLGFSGRPALGLALAAGATVAQVVERRGAAQSPDFTGLLRSVLAVALGYAGAGFVLVRLLHAEFSLAFRSFPALATAMVALAVLILAEGDREQLRAGRLLTVLAALAWAAGGPIDMAPLAYVAAVWLALLAGAGRLRRTVEA